MAAPTVSASFSQPLTAAVEDHADHDADDDASLAGAIFNLTNTVLGGGISLISIPLAAKQVGVVVMPLLEMCSFLVSCYTCHLLVVCSVTSGEDSYAKLGRRYLGRLSFLVPIVIVLNNLGVCVAFLEVFADVIPPLLQGHTTFFLFQRTWLVVLVTGLLLFPVALVRNITGFVVASLIATAACTIFAIYGITLGVESFFPGGAVYPYLQGNSSAVSISGINTAAPGLNTVLSAVGIISLSWTCQFNVLPIYGGLRGATVPRMRVVIVVSMLIAVCSYILFGCFAYLRILQATTGDTLADFDDTPVGQVLRVSVVVALVLTFPLFAFEAAHNLETLFFPLAPGTHQAPGGEILRPTSSELSNQSSLGALGHNRSFFNNSFDSSVGEPLFTPRKPKTQQHPSSKGGKAPEGGGRESPQKEGQLSPMTSGDSSDYGALVSSEQEPDLEGLEQDRGGGLAGGGEEEAGCVDRVRMLGLAFTVVAGLLTVLIQDTAAVIGLVGAACGIPISYVLPPLIYIRLQLDQNRPDWPQVGLCAFILTVGLVTAIACVANTAAGGS